MSKRNCPLAVQLHISLFKAKFRKAQRIWSGVIFGRIGASFITGNCSPYFFDTLGNGSRIRLRCYSRKQERQY